MIAAARFAGGAAQQSPRTKHSRGGPPKAQNLTREQKHLLRLAALVELKDLGWTDAQIRAALKMARSTYQDAQAKVRATAHREIERRLRGDGGAD